MADAKADRKHNDGVGLGHNAMHPLAEGMASAQELGSYFALPQRRPGNPGWSDARNLFQNDDLLLYELVMAYGQRAWDSSNRHVAGSAFLIAYLSRVVFPVVGQFVLARRVPDVSLDNLSFHWNGPALAGRAGSTIDATGLDRLAFAALPSDPAAGHPDAVVAADTDALYVQLKEWLFRENLDIVVAGLRRAAGASLKVSRNSVAFAFSQVFNRLYATTANPGELVRIADVFFSDPDSTLHGQLTMEEFQHRGRKGFFARRAGCCLWWRSPRSNDYCSSCILLSREHQDRRFREIMSGRR